MAGRGSAPGERRGGRQKGTPNKLKAERVAALTPPAGETPLAYMLRVMNDPKAEARRRDWAANAAAPYIHAKQAMVEIGNKGGAPFMVQLAVEDGGVL